MPNVNSVLAVSVTPMCPPKLHQPGKVTITGKSSIQWTFKGTYLDKGNCVVVIEAGAGRDGKTCQVDPANNGGIFPAGNTGKFCEIRLLSGDMEQWSVRVATHKGTDEDETFTAGTGRSGE